VATKYWTPNAAAVAQVTTVTVGGTLSGETFTISVNGVQIASHTDATTTISDTVAALVAAWNLSTHPYAPGITAAAASPTLTLTADTAEVPFAVTLNTPGGSATFGQAATVAPTGPHTWDEADNWSGSAVPSNSDVIVLRDCATNICWGLAGLSTTDHVMHVEQSFKGKIGLRADQFATSADGDTTVSTATEYRATYLQLDMDRIEIGAHLGPGTPAGSQRIKLDDDSGSATTIVVHNTAAAASESNKPAVRLKANSASCDIDVRGGQGGVGVAVDVPGETSTIGDVYATGGNVFLGEGVTVTNIVNHGGAAHVNLGTATCTLVETTGGTTIVDGDQAVTTVKPSGGRTLLHTTGTVTNLTYEGPGECDLTGSGAARTVSTVTPVPGATLRLDPDVVTVTTYAEPDFAFTVSWS